MKRKYSTKKVGPDERIYDVPEDAAVSSMMEFVERLLHYKLDIPKTMDIDIEREHTERLYLSLLGSRKVICAR